MNEAKACLREILTNPEFRIGEPTEKPYSGKGVNIYMNGSSLVAETVEGVLTSDILPYVKQFVRDTDNNRRNIPEDVAYRILRLPEDDLRQFYGSNDVANIRELTNILVADTIQDIPKQEVTVPLRAVATPPPIPLESQVTVPNYRMDRACQQQYAKVVELPVQRQ